MGAESPATSEMRLGECELNLWSTKGCSKNWLPVWGEIRAERLEQQGGPVEAPGPFTNDPVNESVKAGA
jgi:hypothetical protein